MMKKKPSAALFVIDNFQKAVDSLYTKDIAQALSRSFAAVVERYSAQKAVYVYTGRKFIQMMKKK